MFSIPICTPLKCLAKSTAWRKIDRFRWGLQFFFTEHYRRYNDHKWLQIGLTLSPAISWFLRRGRGERKWVWHQDLLSRWVNANYYQPSSDAPTSPPALTCPRALSSPQPPHTPHVHPLLRNEHEVALKYNKNNNFFPQVSRVMWRFPLLLKLTGKGHQHILYCQFSTELLISASPIRCTQTCINIYACKFLKGKENVSVVKERGKERRERREEVQARREENELSPLTRK